MAPQTQLAPEHLSNLPWYMIFLSAAVAKAKIETVSYKVLFTLAMTVIVALVGFGINSVLNGLDKNDKAIIASRIELKEDIKGISQKLDTDRELNNKQEMAIRDLCGRLDDHLRSSKR